MKKLFSLLICLALLTALPFSARATDPSPGPVVDMANLLTEDEENFLSDLAWQLYNDYGIFVCVVTTNYLDGKSSTAYADDFYDNTYYWEYPDGVLLLISTDTREWAISTCGRGIDLLTDYELDQLFFTMSGYLSDDQYFDAFSVYLDTLPRYLAVAPETEPGIGDFIRIFLIALLIGAAAGGITILVMRGQMNTVKPQPSAGNYLVSGSFQLKKHLDFFLYSRVTRSAIPKNNGSSTHRSSGGVRHGGRSGRF